MATTVTSTHRGTSNLAVAPTQNTAPVHEYRCLYTRDLHKKAKKWHDGSLRFHTFNRRVMVYDDTKNYIGDLHYTKEEDFAEGVDIQLDRGVKVEVGERLGETQTDLAPILERQRPEKVVQQPRQTARVTTRPTSTGFTQRSKSLLEVLGPSQGRLGRSRLPLQSPYEQGQPSPRTEAAQPPAKKRRVSSDKENQASDDTQFTTPGRPPLPRPVQLSKTKAPSNLWRDAPVQFEEVLDISSDEEPRQPRGRTAGPQPMQNEAAKKRPDMTKSPSEPTKPSRAVKKVQAKSHVKKGASTAVSGRHAAASRHQQSTTRAVTISSRPSFQGTARLLLSLPKPRCKLTCVLPLRRDTRKRGTSDTPNGEGARRVSALETVPTECSDMLTRIREAEPDYNDKCHSPVQISSSDMSSPRTFAQSRQMTSSPLFVAEDDAGYRQSSPRPIPTQEAFPFTGFSGTGLSQDSDRLLRPQEDIFNINDAPTMIQGRSSCSEVVASSLSTNTQEETPQENENHLPDVVSPTGEFARRTFKRVLSEKDAIDDEEVGRIPGLRGSDAENPLILPVSPNRQITAKPRSPTKIHRCALDTSTLDHVDDDAHEDMQELAKGELGPWTSEEAFLLFDWWPPEKEKPDFWDAHVNKATVKTVVSGPGRACRTGITTARQFLRDDVNVL